MTFTPISVFFRSFVLLTHRLLLRYHQWVVLLTHRLLVRYHQWVGVLLILVQVFAESAVGIEVAVGIEAAVAIEPEEKHDAASRPRVLAPCSVISASPCKISTEQHERARSEDV